MNFSLSDTGLAPLHTTPLQQAPTAPSALQCVGANRSHVARSEWVTEAGYLLRVAEANFKTERSSVF